MFWFSLLFTLIFIITAGLIFTLIHESVDYELLQNLQTIFFSILFVTFFLIVILSFFLGTVITGSITLLLQKMRVASDGNYTVPVEDGALEEVGILASHFNKDIATIKVSTERLAGEIHETIRAEQQLKLFAKVFENALEGITITDANGNIVAVNQSFTTITGYTASEVIGKNPRILRSNRHGPEFYRKMWQSLSEKGFWIGEIWNRRANGEVFPEILSISSICDTNDERTHYVAVFHDITDMKLKEEQIKYKAYHDALTGLPNRFLAKDRLTMAMANAKRKKTKVAVFYMDLDHFKHVNDSLGHPIGDVLLQQVAQRLLSLVREEDTVARLGGDEFQIIGANISSEEEVIDLANRLKQGFTSPFTIENHELSVTLSIGIALYPRDGENADVLIKNADVALYQAKSEGRNKFFLFSCEFKQKKTGSLR